MKILLPRIDNELHRYRSTKITASRSNPYGVPVISHDSRSFRLAELRHNISHHVDHRISVQELLALPLRKCARKVYERA